MPRIHSAMNYAFQSLYSEFLRRAICCQRTNSICLNATLERGQNDRESKGTDGLL